MNTLSLELAVEFEDNKNVHIFCEARVDGIALVNSLRYSISVAALQESAMAPGSYFLITCSCGNAGCAGISNPVTVVHSDKSVVWEISEPAPVRCFSFAADAYRAVVRGALKAFPAQTAAIEAASGKSALPTPRGEEALFLGGDRAV